MKEQKEISPQLEPTKSNEKPIHTDEGMCMLSIKLFDGSSIKQEFKSEDTLHDVRTWLDLEVGIIPSNETMPAFAKSSYPHPVNYAFHRPVLPRITYSEEQESQSLLELELTPRSALILKPIYHEPESTSGDGNPQSVGYIRRAFGVVGTIGRALYSFFDYGTGPAPASYQEEDHDDPERPAPEVTLGLIDDIQQIGLGHPAHTIVMDDRAQSQSSLFNIEHPNIRATREIINSRPTSPRLGSAGSDSNRASAYPSRSSTPRPSGVNRIQMFQDEDKKGVDTYNGNSVNLNERDDNDSE
ncbi:uncharacterized protein SPAPADRAFT_58023 [Spathaspora passalidarum NRRL Y-27907]|uniref:UBX domain-containing protein n=1 Tax=Spathaspora passalidarum (strain NRRL Y-27907 / 11-Y1) TaxID=619300 RepID=G3AFA8_SPAPN|nr:uncharacterized protein SPAPADRAFT_58023 [Spathaspora passalidarum NRRL Y-27907]EGW34897.1 hypothetical protein SPAPADRAFT_58023 [Spathaspora passalidarum NRRL Y-27907]